MVLKSKPENFDRQNADSKGRNNEASSFVQVKVAIQNTFFARHWVFQKPMSDIAMDVLSPKIMLALAVVTTLLLAAVIKKIVDFCLWYRQFTKLMKKIPGPENTHWLYGDLHLVYFLYMVGGRGDD